MTRDAPPLDGFDDATRELVVALWSDDPAVREHTIEEIAPVVDDGLARELLRFARDPAGGEKERGQALIALGPALEECRDEELPDGGLESPPAGAEGWWELPLSSEGYREVTEDLRRIYHDGSLPKLVRRRAVEAAVRAPRDWHREAAAAAWRSDDPEWRLTAVFLMGHLPGFQDEILEAFRGRDPVIRREAMRAAGRSATGEVLAADLLAIAADRVADRDDRLAAIAALADHQPDEAAGVLDRLVDDPDPEVAAAAREALEEADLWEGLGDDDLEDPDDIGFDVDDLAELDGRGEEDW
jgi:hypothetical protein